MTDYPLIPVEQRRGVAKALLPVCKEVFHAYPLGDEFAAHPEMRRLKEELRDNIRHWIDENGVPGYRAKRHNHQPQAYCPPALRKRKIESSNAKK